MLSSLQTYKILLHHTWLSFKRSHHFERSMAVKAIIAFVTFTMLYYFYFIGMLLPGLLEQIFPKKTAVDTLFSLLFYIYAGDLVLRYFMQKVPRQKVQAYLHLPIKRSLLTGIMIIRSWVSIYNFYLFALLTPFFIRTLYHQESAQAFWLAIAGCFLLGGINHAFILWLKTYKRKTVVIAVIMMWIGAVSVSILLFRDQLFYLSEITGNAFIQANYFAFLIPIAIITGLQTLTGKGLYRALYAMVSDAPVQKSSGTSRIERLFHKIPTYGIYWELEWKLLNRNKRASRGFRQWPLIIVFIPFFLAYAREDVLHTYMVFFLMFAGSYGFFHLQYVYSWESRFFDFIASRKISIRHMILSKYYFYTLLAILQAIIIIPMLYFIQPTLMLPMLGFMLYVTGPVFAMLFNLGIGYSTRIDPNKKVYFNMEGTSGTQFIVVLALMLSYIPFMAIAFALPFSFNISITIVLGITGLAFMATHRVWAKKIAAKFEKRKYIQLKKYREK